MSESKKNKPHKTTAFFICVCVAAFLWLIHNLNSSYVYTLKVPVRFVNLPALKLPSNPLPSQLSLTLKLSGLKLIFLKLQKTVKPITIDFNNLKSDARKQVYSIGSNTELLKEALPIKSDVLQVYPDSLVLIEKKGRSKNIPVKALLNLKPSVGFTIVDKQITPPYITVYGDSVSLKKLDTLYTEPIDYTQMNRSVQVSLAVLNPDANLILSTNQIKVDVSVEKLLDHTVTLPIQMTNVPVGCVARCFPQQVKVQYTAPLSAQFPEKGMLVSVNASKAVGRTQKIPLEISVNSTHVRVLNLQPELVEVIILKK